MGGVGSQNESCPKYQAQVEEVDPRQRELVQASECVYSPHELRDCQWRWGHPPHQVASAELARVVGRCCQTCGQLFSPQFYVSII